MPKFSSRAGQGARSARPATRGALRARACYEQQDTDTGGQIPLMKPRTDRQRDKQLGWKTHSEQLGCCATHLRRHISAPWRHHTARLTRAHGRRPLEGKHLCVSILHFSALFRTFRSLIPPSKVGQLRWVCLRPAPVPGTGDGVQASDHASRKTSLTAPPSLLSQNISPSKPLQATKHRIPTHRHTAHCTTHNALRTPPFPPHNNISDQASVTAAPRYLYSGVSRPGDRLWRWQNAPQMRPAALHSRPACHPQITQPLI